MKKTNFSLLFYLTEQHEPVGVLPAPNLNQKKFKMKKLFPDQYSSDKQKNRQMIIPESN